jgi:thiamine-monophosphate kinase
MQLHEWGEEGFVQYLSEQFSADLPFVGIGDDAAVIPNGDDKSWLVTTDALVEGVHFLKDHIPPRDLGFKTVAVNVSDIAAMGGEPKYAFLSVALPKSVEFFWLCELMEGIKEGTLQWKLSLLGGDTVGSKRDVFLNLTLIGTAKREHIKYRTGAKPGDVICVTSYLGDSAGGLKALQKKLPKVKEVATLIQAHHRPQPSSEQGVWLGTQPQVHAMMDISDGLDCDLRRILKSSQVGGVVETTKIPLSPSLKRVSTVNQWDPLECALTGGEDYCLLLTVAPKDYENLQQAFQSQFRQCLFDIGYLNSQSEQLLYLREGTLIEINYKSFNHFNQT